MCDKPSVKLRISLDNLMFDTDDVYARIGSIKQADADDIHEAIIGIIFELHSKCTIKAGYRLFESNYDQSTKNTLSFGNAFFNTGQVITDQLKKSEQIAVFACTIGPEIEKWAKEKLLNGELLLYYLIDNIASIVTERTADYINKYIGKQMEKQGKKVTNRFSPGYCDWSVSEQHLLFSLLPKNFCDIRLNESALMTPIKSISGIIGIGKQVVKQNYSCENCLKKDCTYRMI